MLKYDYGAVLRPSKVTGHGVPARRLRRIIDAFVQDKRALQKSALVRVVNGSVEAQIAAKDRAGKSPNITGFFATFLGAVREREDDELNKAVSDAVLDVLRSVPDAWPKGIPAARAAVMDILRSARTLNDETIVDAIFVAAGRPGDDGQREELRDHTMAALRHRKVAGLEFAPDPKVLRSAAKKQIRTKERISIEFPASLQDVRVITERHADGSATITIQTDEITSDELISESLSTIRRLADD